VPPREKLKESRGKMKKMLLNILGAAMVVIVLSTFGAFGKSPSSPSPAQSQSVAAQATPATSSGLTRATAVPQPPTTISQQATPTLTIKSAVLVDTTRDGKKDAVLVTFSDSTVAYLLYQGGKLFVIIYSPGQMGRDGQPGLASVSASPDSIAIGFAGGGVVNFVLRGGRLVAAP